MGVGSANAGFTYVQGLGSCSNLSALLRGAFGAAIFLRVGVGVDCAAGGLWPVTQLHVVAVIHDVRSSFGKQMQGDQTGKCSRKY